MCSGLFLASDNNNNIYECKINLQKKNGGYKLVEYLKKLTTLYLDDSEDDEGDDIGAATVTPHGEGEANTCAAEGAADDGTHEVAKLRHIEEVLHMQHLLPEDEAERTHHDAIDCVGAELRPQHFEADYQQYTVDDEVHHTDGELDTHSIIQHRRDTTHAATDNLGRQHERRPCKGVNHDPQRDNHVGQDVVFDVLIIHFFKLL